MTLHNTGKVLMGSTSSNIKTVINKKGTVAAGIACHLKSDGTASVLKSDGTIIGISLGKDLSNTDKIAIATKGLGVPVQLKASFDPIIGAVVLIDNTSGLATGDGTNTAVNAVYASGRIGGTGVNGGQQEDGTTVGAAFIDFPGGL